MNNVKTLFFNFILPYIPRYMGIQRERHLYSYAYSTRLKTFIQHDAQRTHFIERNITLRCFEKENLFMTPTWNYVTEKQFALFCSFMFPYVLKLILARKYEALVRIV